MKITLPRKDYLFFFSLIFLFIGDSFSAIKALVIFFVIILFYFNHLKKFLDANFFLLFLFFGLYFFVYQLAGIQEASFNMRLLVFPPILYCLGKLLASKTRYSYDLVIFLWFIGLLISHEALIGVVANVFQEGFDSGGRNIAIRSGEAEISSTVLAGGLVILLSFGGVLFSSYEFLRKSDRFLFFIVFLLALIVGFRLGSRTSLVVSGLSIVVGILFGRRQFFYIKAIVIIGLSLLAFFVLGDSSELVLLTHFQDRVNDDEFGFSTGGGRLEKWGSALSILFTAPFGWDINLAGHAHNFWLDVARNAGWVVFLFSILITVLALRSILFSMRRNFDDVLYLTLIRCVATGFGVLFMLEPISDGYVNVLAAFCFFWGVAHGYRPPKFDSLI